MKTSVLKRLILSKGNSSIDLLQKALIIAQNANWLHFIALYNIFRSPCRQYQFPCRMSFLKKSKIAIAFPGNLCTVTARYQPTFEYIPAAMCGKMYRTRPDVARPSSPASLLTCRAVSCVVSCRVDCRVVSFRIVPCRVSCRVVSCVVSCRVASCRVSCRVVSCRVWCVVSGRLPSALPFAAGGPVSGAPEVDSDTEGTAAAKVVAGPRQGDGELMEMADDAEVEVEVGAVVGVLVGVCGCAFC